jgi:hypothetical protein
MSKLPEYANPQELELEQKIKELIAFNGSDPETFDANLISQLISSSLKLLKENPDTGQLKLMTRAFKEMRYAYHIFNQHPSGRRISIFGSARTPENHPDYLEAKNFSSLMAKNGWVCITGAADGIMKAGLEGAQKASSFGLSIRLPFETPSNSLLAGDPKLITFRYFFTRKLMFLSHSDAVAAFPGGVGTQDELFEVLTLMQTGKANIIPVVLIQGAGTYWQEWQDYVFRNLLDKGWISQEDLSLYYMAHDSKDAVAHILQFYHRYHSSRYVKDTLVLRLLSHLNHDQIAQLNQEFGPVLVKEGEIYLTTALPEEDDHLELPRLAFVHNRRHFGTLRQMIDRINSF